jgi:hypothetical protein
LTLLARSALRDAWWQWQLSQNEAVLANGREAAARRLRDDVARRYQAGDLARADLNQAEGALAQARAAQAVRLVGLPPDEETAVLAVDVHGQSCLQTAERLHVSVDTVKPLTNPMTMKIIASSAVPTGSETEKVLQIANDAALTYERLGSPEGELALGQAVIYLAIAAKSNAGYTAYNAARAFVKQDKSREVPVHLRNAPTQLMKELGHGHAYRYAHDEPHGYAAGERYLPEGMAEPGWYQPVPRGLESKIADKLAFLRGLDAEADSDTH